ncbi:MAG: TetR/AcrR family transcriptional regulator [Planctomycetota bacterium]|jgi:AcrR family transcriptional regulator|nr:TetR/AcrR family transcriptional regulator [Planctomycetota bacterium]
MPRTTTPKRRTPRQARSKKTVERILNAATKLLAHEGLDGFNTNRIAQEAGVGVGSVYEYFPGKDEILEPIINRLANREAETILDLLSRNENRPLESIVWLVVKRLSELYLEHHDLYVALRGVPAFRSSIGTRPSEQQVLGKIRALLQKNESKLHPIADIELTAFTLFHLVESLTYQTIEQGADRWPLERSVEEIVHAALRYIGLTPGPSSTILSNEADKAAKD